MTITEKTNTQLSITLDNVEDGTPVSVFGFPRYGEKSEGPDNRIQLASYQAPAKGEAHPVIADTYDMAKGEYVIEIWSNIDTEDEQLEVTDQLNIQDARAV